MRLSGSTGFSVANSFIAQNTALTNPIVRIEGSSTGQFRFNTFAGNESATTLPGVFQCLEPTFIEDSIVASNTGTSSQFTPGCTLRRTVIGRGDATGVVRGGTDVEPEFQNKEQGDFRIRADAGCCVDKAAKDDAIRTDYFGNRRPQGSAADIGAHEVSQ